MTFLELTDDAMGQLGLTSADARSRIKRFLNQRYREVQTSVNLARTRRSTATFSVTSGNTSTTATGVAKLLTLYDDAVTKRVLIETTLPAIRAKDPDLSVTGPASEYAITSHVDDQITLFLWPKPNANATLKADTIAAGTELVEDTDVPDLPVDFHDLLVRGAKADELMRQEKAQRFAQAEEQRFEKRLADLRYFLAKSAYLSKKAQDREGLVAAGQVWPYGGQMVS